MRSFLIAMAGTKIISGQSKLYSRICVYMFHSFLLSFFLFFFKYRGERESERESKVIKRYSVRSYVISFHRRGIISEFANPTNPGRAINRNNYPITDQRRTELRNIRAAPNNVCAARLSRRRARSFGKAVKPVKSTKVASMTLGFSWSDAGRTYSRRRRARREGRREEVGPHSANPT